MPRGPRQTIASLSRPAPQIPLLVAQPSLANRRLTELGHDVAELHRKGWSLSVAQTIACGAVLAVIECEPIPKNVCPFERSCGGVFWQGFNPQSEGLVESARRLATDPYMLPAGGRTRLNPCRGGAGADNPPGNREGRARRHAEGGRVDVRLAASAEAARAVPRLAPNAHGLAAAETRRTRCSRRIWPSTGTNRTDAPRSPCTCPARTQVRAAGHA